VGCPTQATTHKGPLPIQRGLRFFISITSRIKPWQVQKASLLHNQLQTITRQLAIIIIIIIVKPSGSESSPGCSCLLLRVGRGEWVAPLRQRPTRGCCPPSEGYVSSSPLRLESSHGKFKNPLCCIINCKQSRGSSHPSACISFSVDMSKIPL